MARGARLEASEIDSRLQDMPEWRLVDGMLHRELRFPSFADAFAFMTRVAFAAESLDHHPDWSNSYRTVVIDLRSHDVDGISERDFRLAAAIDEAAAARAAGAGKGGSP